MSVRVNLLPGDVRERGRANQMRVAVIVVGLVFLAILGTLTMLQRGSISDAEDRLAAVQARNTGLQADIAALQPFADLEDRAADTAATVGLAMGAEASFAGLLQDVSTVLSPAVELQNVSITLSDEARAPSAGGSRVVFGEMTATGRTIGIAPAMERLLIDLGRVAAFENVYLDSSTTDDDGVATFIVSVELGPEVQTGRYDSLGGTP